MKKECVHTRKSLRKYLRGHLFTTEMKRIERHLKGCPVCNSEFQALRLSKDTQQLLKDITPPETVMQRMRWGVTGMSRLTTLLYRPLWMLIVVGIGALLYTFVYLPYREASLRSIEQEIMSQPSIPPSPSSPLTEGAPAGQYRQGAAAPVAAPHSGERLEVTITVPDNKGSVQAINDVMKGHAFLRTMLFSDTVKEIAGSLTEKELLTFFNRIEAAGRVSYSRARLESFPSAEPIPFVIRLRTAPQAAVAAETATPGVHKPVDKPVQKQGDNPVNKPVENTVPSTAPAQ
jgi:hypothetical protein